MVLQMTIKGLVLTGIDLNSMIRRNLRDFELNSMIRRNLHDFVNGIESFNGTLVVPTDANFVNMGGEQNDLVLDIDDDQGIPWVGINPQTLLNFHDVCQQASFANDEIICYKCLQWDYLCKSNGFLVVWMMAIVVLVMIIALV